MVSSFSFCSSPSSVSLSLTSPFSSSSWCGDLGIQQPRSPTAHSTPLGPGCHVSVLTASGTFHSTCFWHLSRYAVACIRNLFFHCLSYPVALSQHLVDTGMLRLVLDLDSFVSLLSAETAAIKWPLLPKSLMGHLIIGPCFIVITLAANESGNLVFLFVSLSSLWNIGKHPVRR